MRHPVRVFFLIALGAISAPALAGEGWAASPLGKAKFGPAWRGAAAAPDALMDKVVLVKSFAEW